MYKLLPPAYGFVILKHSQTITINDTDVNTRDDQLIYGLSFSICLFRFIWYSIYMGRWVYDYKKAVVLF